MPGAIVTGSADGIGLNTALAFARAGYSVHICDANAVALEATLRQHPHLRGTVANVARPADVNNVVADALQWLPSIDALVNNVGISGPLAAFEDIPHEVWLEVLQVNLLSMVEFIRAVAPLMKKQKRGAILNVSTASVHTRPAMRSVYNVSKAAVEALTLSLAKELGPQGIRCNAIRPGLVDGGRLSRVLSDVARQRNMNLETIEAELLSRVSLRSKVQMSDISEMSLFLCSESARYVSGQIISVCGDLQWEG